MSKILFEYLPEQNKRNAFIPGVKLGDITEKEFARLKPWLQASVEASPMYRKVQQSSSIRSKKGKEKEGDDLLLTSELVDDVSADPFLAETVVEDVGDPLTEYDEGTSKEV